MLKEKLSLLDEKWKNKRLSKINEDVLNSYKKAGIFLDSIDIEFLPQKSMSTNSFYERTFLDYTLRNSNYTLGLYSGMFDTIFIDNNCARFLPEFHLKRILSHEYGHAIYKKFYSEIRDKFSIKKKTEKNDFEQIESNETELSLEEKINKNMKDLLKIKRTNLEKKYFELETYMEEFLVESISDFLFPHNNSEKKLFEYTRLNSGKYLVQDVELFEKIENILYKHVYERMNSESIRDTISRFPIIRSKIMKEFEKYHRKQLNVTN